MKRIKKDLNLHSCYPIKFVKDYNNSSELQPSKSNGNLYLDNVFVLINEI